MKRSATTRVIAAAFAGSTFAADDVASAKEAEAMVAKVVKAIDSNKEEVADVIACAGIYKR